MTGRLCRQNQAVAKSRDHMRRCCSGPISQRFASLAGGLWPVPYLEVEAWWGCTSFTTCIWYERETLCQALPGMYCARHLAPNPNGGSDLGQEMYEVREQSSPEIRCGQSGWGLRHRWYRENMRWTS